MDHQKEKIIQEGWKREINQMRNRLNCSMVNPPKGASSLLVGMGGWTRSFILEMDRGLSSTRPGCGNSLYQGRSFTMDEVP